MQYKYSVTVIQCATDLQLFSIRVISHFSTNVHQIKHILHVNEGLLDQAIICSKKIERNIQLDNVRSKQNKVPNCEVTLHHSES